MMCSEKACGRDDAQYWPEGKCYTYFKTLANIDRLFLISRPVHDTVDNPGTTNVLIKNIIVIVSVMLFPHNGPSMFR